MNTIKQQEEALFAKWKGAQTNWVKDGAVNPEAYAISNPKVLYILKEANGGKEKQWAGGDLRDLLNKPTRWQTWNNVARWQYAIAHLEKSIDWKEVDYISKSKRTELLNNISVINLKKVPGSKQSNMNEIKSFAQKDIAFIKAQIAIYKPNIVICGGTGNIVKELKIMGSFSKWNTSKRGIEYCNLNQTIILNFKHPGVYSAKKKLFWDVVHTLREVQQKEAVL